MKKMMGYCGIDCKKCEVRIATINNDDASKNKIAERWSKLNNTEITADMINCIGCREVGPKTPFCDYMCLIKKCAVSNNFDNCSDCKSMSACAILKEIIINSKEALNNLRRAKK